MRHLLSADFLKWLYPGMHIKRWLGLMIIGVAIMTFGLAYILREAYISGFTFPGFVYYLTLQFIPRYVRGGMFMFSAGLLILYSFWKLNHTIVSAVMPNRNGNESIVSMIYPVPYGYEQNWRTEGGKRGSQYINLKHEERYQPQS